MLGVRLEPDLEARLEKLARKTGRSKSYYAKEAIRQFLEDREDYLLGIAVSRAKRAYHQPGRDGATPWLGALNSPRLPRNISKS